jgi:predicted DNA binding CopG/RHH family protein
LLPGSRQYNTHYIRPQSNVKRNKTVPRVHGRQVTSVRTEYDFSKSKKNPYLKKLRKQITIRLDVDTIDYFKNQAEATGIPYQNLINLYLSDCVANKKTVKIAWK